MIEYDNLSEAINSMLLREDNRPEEVIMEEFNKEIEIGRDLVQRAQGLCELDELLNLITNALLKHNAHHSDRTPIMDKQEEVMKSLIDEINNRAIELSK